MRIRPYRPSDWQSVCAIWNRAKVDEFRGEVDLAAIVPLESDAQMQASFRRSEVLVAELGDEVVGFGGREGSVIGWLFVHPEHRRRGVASRLMIELLAHIDGAAELMVLRGNAAAIALYRGFGFAVTASVATSHNGYPVEALRMERKASG